MIPLLRIAVLGLCVLLLAYAVDWRDAVGPLRSADLRWCGVALLLLTLQTALSAERWRITAAPLGITFTFRHAIGEYYFSQVVNQSFPGGVLGDANRAVRSRDQAGLIAAGQAVVFERLSGQFGLLALLITGLALGLGAPGLHSWPAWFSASSAAFLGICVVVAVAVFTIMRQFAPRARRIGIVRAFAQAVLAKPVWWRQVVLSLATALCNVAAFACCAVAIGAPLSVLSAITLIPIILFAMILPISVAGWGLREGAAAALFPVIGASSGEGLAASVAFGVTILASVLPGFVLGWVLRTRAESTS